MVSRDRGEPGRDGRAARVPHAEPPVRLGVSSCLLGASVRFDGGHKRDRFLTDVLGRYVEWVPVCPELESGMGVPRESVRLEGEVAAPRMVGTQLSIMIAAPGCM